MEINKLDLFIFIILIIMCNFWIYIYTQHEINKIKTEKFTVADAQDINNYKDNNEKLLNISNSFESDQLQQPSIKKTVDNDRNLEKDDDFSIQVKYGDPSIKQNIRNDKKYVTDIDFGWSPPKQYVSCANSSIAQRYKTGKKYLLPFQVSCEKPNKLTAENYYKTHYKGQIIPIEDYMVKGYNYLEYTNTVNPYQLRDLKILSQNTKGLPPEQTKYQNIPSGWNYAFHNTPAMPLP